MSIARRRDAQRGAALIIVLWTALLLSVVMAGALGSARIEAKIAAARAEKLKAREALLSALDLAAWRVATGAHEEGASGLIVEGLAVNGYTVDVSFSIEGEKIDLNLAGEDVWRNFLVAAGLERGEAEQLAAQIADWRDADDLARPNGAERRDYALVKDKSIGDRPFNGLEELNLVLGMTPDLFSRLSPALTLFGTGEAPSPTLFQRLGNSGATLTAPQTRPLGTAVQGPTPGVRRVIEAVTREDGGALAPQRRGLVFRVTGDTTAPAAIILSFVPAAEQSQRN